MRSVSTLRVLMLLALAGVVTPAQAQSCLPNDKGAQATLAWAQAMATGSDSAAQAARTHLGIPSTTASKVTLVTDTQTCAKAAQALASGSGISATNRKVYVIKVATRYIVKDPSVSINGSWLSMVMDSKFVILSRFTG